MVAFGDHCRFAKGPAQIWVAQFGSAQPFYFAGAGHCSFDQSTVGQKPGGLAGIREPIPAEHAFAADGEVVFIGFDQFEEEIEVVVFDVGVDEFFTLPIHHADVHLACVEVDSAIELRCRGVILHRCNTS